ncbi:Protein FAR1-RELATED SEQUENCE [Abeliophyllum distichum]|uniref:Protein FAR1-RELATED SEQUENCE n=1 Tax=Abeliophyllum distichum TaxID=126358 RepID=A0ABD1RX33_9LAMI
MLGHDAETLIEHFTFEKEKNPNFVFDYETDDENKFVRYFWADCESRRSYAYFGDVVVFDTTYNTNRALVYQRHEELAANHIDLTQKPKVTTTLMVENQMVQIYTKKILLLFQNELVQSNSYICSKRSSFDEAKVYAVQRFEPGRTSDRTRQTKNAKQARVFDPTTGSYVYTDPGHSLMSRHNIDTGGEVGMSRNRNKSVEEAHVVCDSNPVRAKGCGKRLKSRKEKTLSQSNRQCRACGTSCHDRKTCPTLQNSLDNTYQPQYSQDPSDQQYQAPDPQYAYQAPDSHYAYHVPDSQYSYHASDPQYAYHASDPQYAYHAPNPQYSITGSNNASYSLDPREYDARYNTRH